MEAEKFYNLLSASGKPGNASGIIQTKSEYLRTKGAKDTNPSSRAEEDERQCPSSNSEAEKRGEFLLSLPSVLLRPSVGWRMPAHIGEGTLLY